MADISLTRWLLAYFEISFEGISPLMRYVRYEVLPCPENRTRGYDTPSGRPDQIFLMAEAISNFAPSMSVPLRNVTFILPDPYVDVELISVIPDIPATVPSIIDVTSDSMVWAEASAYEKEMLKERLVVAGVYCILRDGMRAMPQTDRAIIKSTAVNFDIPLFLPSMID